MKKAIIVLFALLCVAGAVVSEDFSKSGMVLPPKTIDVNAGIGDAWDYGFSFNAGAEYVLGKFDIATHVPLSYGVAARASLYSGEFDDKPLGLGAFGTLHFCWASLELPSDLAWMSNFDSYIGLGLDILPDAGFDGIFGLSYFFSKNVAANVEAGISGSQVGVLFKL
jgi:hypothetical protein